MTGDLLKLFDPVISPNIFKIWGTISCVAGALERRVWMQTATGQLFPNIFMILAGPPGTGKSTVINPLARLWTKTGILKVAPNTLTFASLIDVMAEGVQSRMIDSNLLIYTPMLVAASEFGSLISTYDQTMLTRMSEIWDGPPKFISRTRGGPISVELEMPLLHMIVGVTPKFLDSLLPETAWEQGFMARNLVVYSGEASRPTYAQLFNPRTAEQNEQEEKCVSHLKALCDLHGEVRFTEEAGHTLAGWINSGQHPVPKHPKLSNYCNRRFLQLLKISMALCAASFSLVVEARHIHLAMDLLFELEEVMPDIFRDMVYTSDAEAIDQIYHWMIHQTSGNRPPVTRKLLQGQIGRHVPVQAVDRFIDYMESTGVIVRVPGAAPLYKAGER